MRQSGAGTSPAPPSIQRLLSLDLDLVAEALKCGIGDIAVLDLDLVQIGAGLQAFEAGNALDVPQVDAAQLGGGERLEAGNGAVVDSQEAELGSLGKAGNVNSRAAPLVEPLRQFQR